MPAALFDFLLANLGTAVQLLQFQLLPVSVGMQAALRAVLTTQEVGMHIGEDCPAGKEK